MFDMKLTLPVLLFSSVLFTASADAQVKHIKTICGTGTGAFSGDGAAATGAELHGPYCVSVDGTGNVYILDKNNFRIRKIFTSGIIVTIAGTGGLGSTGDGSLGTSAELRPYGMAVDKNKNVYVADAAFHKIRKINNAGIITTFAGTGVIGSTGDGGAALSATFNGPYGLATDEAGNVYVADGLANVVRKISGGIITRLAGNDTAGFAGDDGPAYMAQLDSPYAVATDRKGNVYISDMMNNRIRRVDASGIITTYAGTGVKGYAGDGGPAALAELDRPAGLATDTLGNLYIADADNDVIRMVDTAGIITTVVGNGTPGFGGDLGPVNGCNLHTPFGVAVDKYGEIYIADANNQRIRKTYTTVGVNDVPQNTTVDLFPNPVKDKFSVAGLDAADVVSVFDVTGKPVTTATQVRKGSEMEVNLSGCASGIYLLRVTDASGNSKAATRLVKE
jgi:hypothetical protein